MYLLHEPASIHLLHLPHAVFHFLDDLLASFGLDDCTAHLALEELHPEALDFVEESVDKGVDGLIVIVSVISCLFILYKRISR
jgi:hypothetical protein